MNNQIMTNEDIIQMLATKSSQGQGRECRVETKVIEPQTINNSYCVFHLNNAGILDKSSRIKLAVYTDGANTQLSQVAGVYALIQSAEIKNSMGEVICKNHDFQNIAVLRSCYINEEQRKNRNSFVTGSYNVYKYDILNILNSPNISQTFELFSFLNINDYDIIDCKALSYATKFNQY